MIFNRLGADLQDVADLLGGLALGDELENLALPARQLIERAFPAGDSIRGKFNAAAGVVTCIAITRNSGTRAGKPFANALTFTIGCPSTMRASRG